MALERPWTEEEFAERLARGEVTFRPATLYASSRMADPLEFKLVTVEWRDVRVEFEWIYLDTPTPAMLKDKAFRAARRSLRSLLVTPYLSERAMLELESNQVNAIDLCQNGFIFLTPGAYIWRSGSPNRFKQTKHLLNVFKGTSSILSRCFLLRPTFESLVELQEFALSRVHQPQQSILTKGTVSKAVNALVEERLITRTKQHLELTDPMRLMSLLRENYQPSKGPTIIGKTPFSPQEIMERLSGSQVRYVATGKASASRYGLISGPDRTELYVDDFNRASQSLQISPTPVFPSISVHEDTGDVVYFDSQSERESNWASPVQTWLELTTSRDAREKTVGRELEELILQRKLDLLR